MITHQVSTKLLQQNLSDKILSLYVVSAISGKLTILTSLLLVMEVYSNTFKHINRCAQMG